MEDVTRIVDSIDWSDGDAKLTRYFTVKEAIWLPRWNRLAEEADGLTHAVKCRLVTLLLLMDEVREFFGRPISVHVCYRPSKYNALVKGARSSAHLASVNRSGQPLRDDQMEAAIDFHVAGVDCDEARQRINDDGLLDRLGLRMEQMDGGNWVHLDNRAPGAGGRFFVADNDFAPPGDGDTMIA
jgi:hypothetical protein